MICASGETGDGVAASAGEEVAGAGTLGIEAGVGCSAGEPRKVLPQDTPPQDTGEGVAAGICSCPETSLGEGVALLPASFSTRSSLTALNIVSILSSISAGSWSPGFPARDGE